MYTRQRSQLLTQYLDGVHDDAAHAEITHKIETDPHIRKEIQELRRTRDLLAGRAPLPESPWLTERVMNRIRDARAQGEDPLPDARRFGTIPATMLGLAILALAAFAWTQRDDIVRYINDTGTQVQMAYEDTILEGWIMPLFQRTSRDHVLEFAMFGTLPLDAEDGTVLRVDENSDRGFRVELAQAAQPTRPSASVAELYEEIRPTASQQRAFDTLFHYAQRRIESAVLTKRNKEIALDPSISRFHTIILSGIAANLDDAQRARFEHFLEERDAAYTFVAQRLSGEAPRTTQPDDVADRFRAVHSPEEFVVLTGDRATVVRLGLDMDSLRHLMQQLEDRIPRIDVRVRELARNFGTPHPPGTPTPPSAQPGITVTPHATDTDRPVISIRIDEDDMFLQASERFEDLRQRIVVLRRDGARHMDDNVRITRERMREQDGVRIGVRPAPQAFPHPPIPPMPDDETRRRIRIRIAEDSNDVRQAETDTIVITDPAAPQGFRRVVPIPLPPMQPEFELRVQPIPPAPKVRTPRDTSIDI